MTLLAIKAALLAVALALGCAGGPDELELGYGHFFSGDSSLEGWEIRNDDTDMLTVGLVWKLKPTEVIVRNPVVPPVEWTLRPATTSSGGPDVSATTSGSQDVQDAAIDEEQLPTPGEITDAIGVFDTFGTVTKIGFFLLLGLLIWIGRHRIVRWIPGGKNGNDKG